jgi:hypothetical protein
MEHFEFLYVLHRAHLLRAYIEEAEKVGEDFHVSEHFCPLASGLEAQAQIRKINLTDTEPVLILRLRFRPDRIGGREEALKVAHVFFSGKYTEAPTPIEEGGWVEHVFFSPDVLRPVTMSEAFSAKN